MHALVSAVLFRMPCGDALRPDTQLDPPYRQTRQPRNRGRGKWRSIIRTDRLRQAVLAKGRFKNRLHARRVRLLHRLTAQQIPAVGITDGQWIDAFSVASAEPALEIR